MPLSATLTAKCDELYRRRALRRRWNSSPSGAAWEAAAAPKGIQLPRPPPRAPSNYIHQHSLKHYEEVECGVHFMMPIPISHQVADLGCPSDSGRGSLESTTTSISHQV
ncbi:Protein of unknown function [Gryllus bimaculatus]|nr:Protein of unknown function [Gryllus bimaculatus]